MLDTKEIAVLLIIHCREEGIKGKTIKITTCLRNISA